MSDQKNEKPKGGVAPGLAIIGCLATGTIALVGGFLGLLRMEVAGTGICLIPAALAFGIVAYISFSD